MANCQILPYLNQFNLSHFQSFHFHFLYFSFSFIYLFLHFHFHFSIIMLCSVSNFQSQFMYDNLFSGMRLQQSCDGKNVHLFFFGKMSFLSNFSPSTLVYEDKTFTSATQAFEYTKAKFFNDDDAANQILNLTNTSDMATLGFHAMMKKKGKQQKEWKEAAEFIMYNILKAKFGQNQWLRDELVRTLPLELVKANPYDKFFGIGMSMNNGKINCRHSWNGQNVMGKLLEKIRTESLI